MNKVLLDYAQRIAILLDAGLVATANDLYTNMLKDFPLVKWEQLASGGMWACSWVIMATMTPQ